MLKLKRKKGIIIFIIGVILASSISVYATTTYLASQVTYKDGKSVEDALNYLYENMSSGGSGNFESTQIGEFNPILKVNNGVYLEVSSNATANANIPIRAYLFLVNGKVAYATTKDTGYITNLNRNTKYTISVIAVDENGKCKKSTNLDVTTQNKVYLYNNGDQCTALTGGWEPSLDGYDNSSMTNVKPKLEFNNDNIHMYYDSSTENGQQGSINIINDIDYSKYNKLYITYTGTLGKYSSGSTIRMVNKYNQSYSEIKTLIYTQAITNKTTEMIDLSTINNIGIIYPYIQAFKGDGGTASINIYEMWLE